LSSKAVAASRKGFSFSKYLPAARVPSTPNKKHVHAKAHSALFTATQREKANAAGLANSSENFFQFPCSVRSVFFNNIMNRIEQSEGESGTVRLAIF
jgi:hypothetical protein